MNRIAMTLLGFVMILLGFMSLVLALIGIRFSFLGFIDDWFSGAWPWVCKLTIMVCGVLLFYFGRSGLGEPKGDI